MTEILDDIDAAVAYLESPEYLAQTSQVYACTGMHDCSHCASELTHMDGGNVVSFRQSASVDAFSNADPYRAPGASFPLSGGPVSAPVYGFDEVSSSAFDTRENRQRVDRLAVRSPWWTFRPYVINREPFRTHGALRAEIQTPTDYDRGMSFGHLPSEYHPSVCLADYVVYSYDTPIAWHSSTSGWWWIPGVRYSVTTSRHQSKIRTALHDLTINE